MHARIYTNKINPILSGRETAVTLSTFGSVTSILLSSREDNITARLLFCPSLPRSLVPLIPLRKRAQPPRQRRCAPVLALFCEKRFLQLRARDVKYLTAREAVIEKALALGKKTSGTVCARARLSEREISARKWDCFPEFLSTEERRLVGAI